MLLLLRALIALALVLCAACAGDNNARIIDCGAVPDAAYLGALIDRANGSYDALNHGTTVYFRTLFKPLVDAGCEYISMTQANLTMVMPPQVRILLPSHNHAHLARTHAHYLLAGLMHEHQVQAHLQGGEHQVQAHWLQQCRAHLEQCAQAFFEARGDAWRKGGLVTARALPNGAALEAENTADVERDRAVRHRIWTRGIVLSAEPKMLRRARIASVFVSDSPARFDKHVEQWGAHMLSHFFYARQHDYDMLLYVRRTRMPDGVSGHFSKIPGVYGALYGIGYDYVLGSDWDAYVDPLSAVPLPVLTLGWQRAGFFVQSEHHMCSCVLIYRNFENTRRFMHEWWELGLTGVFDGWAAGGFDQAAMKTLVHKHVRTVTGDAHFFNASYTPRKKASNEPKWLPRADYIAHERVLRAQSDVGFVSMEEPMDHRHVALHSCGGRWAGCIPHDMPALIQHHGHQMYKGHDYRPDVVRVAQMWLSIARGAWVADHDQASADPNFVAAGT